LGGLTILGAAAASPETTTQTAATVGWMPGRCS